ncbi:Mpv17/PMP22 [Gracilaria domingensis]|nr:Mpv17/PMP22 [Gracilaria domingensis]
MALQREAFSAPLCVLWKLRRIAQLTSFATQAKKRMELPLLQPHERTALLSQPPAPPPPPPPPLLNRNTSEGDDEDGGKFNLASMYMKLLHSRPLLTKVVTSALISAISDLIAQAIDGNSKVDVMRNVAFLLAGALLTAPIFHVAYDLFEHTIPGTTVQNVVLQVLGDQLVAAPLWGEGYTRIDERVAQTIHTSTQGDVDIIPRGAGGKFQPSAQAPSGAGGERVRPGLHIDSFVAGARTREFRTQGLIVAAMEVVLATGGVVRTLTATPEHKS